MISPAGRFGDSLLGICTDFSREQDEFTYLIAVETSSASALVVPEGFAELTVPAATWAVFEAIGPLPQSIQDVTKQVFSEWFPSTGYEHADGPELEVYPCPNGTTCDADCRCEIWIPVVRHEG